MNWLRQTKEPLFPDILWSRPENKRYAGKLLIIGGHQQSFSAVSEAYSAAAKAGIGTSRVILPDKLQKMLSSFFPEAEYAPSTHIGSFGRQALDSLLEAAEWADGVLLAGDFGKNSETAILLESFIEKYPGKLALAGDSLDYFLNHPTNLVNRGDTLLITNLARLQKLAAPALIQQKADFIQVIGQINEFAIEAKASIVTTHSKQVIVACGQQMSTTVVKQEPDITALAAYASVWWLQHPEKPFESLTSAAWCLSPEL